MRSKSKIQAVDGNATREPEDDRADSQVLRISEPARDTAIASLGAGKAAAWDGAARTVTLRVGGVDESVRLDDSVDPVVIARAVERGEWVITLQRPDAKVAIGVLRTSATPGLDTGDDYVIRARRISVEAEHELHLTSGVARLIVAAVGRVEIIAKNITSRASAVHKIIGRAIHLN